MPISAAGSGRPVSDLLAGWEVVSRIIIVAAVLFWILAFVLGAWLF